MTPSHQSNVERRDRKWLDRRHPFGPGGYQTHPPIPPRYYYGVHRDLEMFRLLCGVPYRAGDATRRGKFRR